MVVLMKSLFLLLAIQCSPAQGLVPDQYVKIIFHYCAETGVPLYIAAGMAKEESNWNPLARNKIAGGLFQLSFAHHAEFRDRYNGGKEFSEFDPVANTRIALRYVAHLYRHFGTYRKALTYYACGYPSGVVRSVRELVSRELEGV